MGSAISSRVFPMPECSYSAESLAKRGYEPVWVDAVEGRPPVLAALTQRPPQNAYDVFIIFSHGNAEDLGRVIDSVERSIFDANCEGAPQPAWSRYSSSYRNAMKRVSSNITDERIGFFIIQA